VGRDPNDDRSAFAKATHWSSRIMTVALEMSVPGLVGYWLDKRFGTKFILLIAGVLLGCAAASWQLSKIAKEASTTRPEGPSRNTNGERDG